MKYCKLCGGEWEFNGGVCDNCRDRLPSLARSVAMTDEVDSRPSCDDLGQTDDCDQCGAYNQPLVVYTPVR